jgi:hypothetical protein
MDLSISVFFPRRVGYPGFARWRTVKAMSSLEIAALCEKRHNKVRRGIK